MSRADSTHPHFQGQFHSTIEWKARVRVARPKLAENDIKAVEAVTAKYEAEKAAASAAGEGSGLV